MPVNLSELRELLAAINQTDIEELTLKSADFELTVRRSLQVSQVTPPMSDPARFRERGPELLSPELSEVGFSETAAVVPSSGGSRTSPSVGAAPPPGNDRRLQEIPSPMVGTFYRAPAPDESPFVEVGDRIRAGQTVCIIEAMKLMNEIEAEFAGEIVEILVQNGEPVEYGQPLMRVNPD